MTSYIGLSKCEYFSIQSKFKRVCLDSMDLLLLLPYVIGILIMLTLIVVTSPGWLPFWLIGKFYRWCETVADPEEMRFRERQKYKDGGF